MQGTEGSAREERTQTRLFVCIHGHYYQPPRENPWLERIEVQDSAAPFHDWNERICAECYGPNTHARIQDGSDRVCGMINNFEWLSFNIGPTLLAWLDQHAPRVLAKIQEADSRSSERCHGHGNAIAQGYNHIILPLAQRRDKEIQVRWGIEAFRHYFQREPEGMWLPETAVDTETLEVLAEHNIRFTLLCPSQAKRSRCGETGQWIDHETQPVDTRRPYLCRLPSGKDIVLFFYDGEVAQKVAFQRLLRSGEDFCREMLARFDSHNEEAQMVHFATDGETFGHHHQFGEMAIARFISHLENDSQKRMTNYGEFISLFPPTWEVEIVENSSWSCAHGVERWRSDCGCRTGGAETQQRWRAPLREALDDLKIKLDDVFEREARPLFDDPWAVLDSYVRILIDREEEGIQKLLTRWAGRVLAEKEVVRALKLFEMQRHGELMFTSCAWFFDEISGIEPVQVLKFAARAIQLAENNFAVELKDDFLKILEKAPSNVRQIGDGRKLWEQEIEPAVIDLERVLAHFAISTIFRKDTPLREGFAYSREDIDAEVREVGQVHFSVGVAEVASHITLQKAQDIYAAIHFGGLDVQFFWKPYGERGEYELLKQDLVETFEGSSLGDLYQRLLYHFEQPTHELMDLFLDEQRRIVERILRGRVDTYRTQFENLFDRDHTLLKRLGQLKYPIPETMRMAATVSTTSRIRRLVENAGVPEDLQPLSSLMEQAKQWEYQPDRKTWGQFFLVVLEKRIESLWAAEEATSILQQAEAVLDAAGMLDVSLNLWNVQTLYVQICREREKELESFKGEVSAFANRLLLSPEVLPENLR